MENPSHLISISAVDNTSAIVSPVDLRLTGPTDNRQDRSHSECPVIPRSQSINQNKFLLFHTWWESEAHSWFTGDYSAFLSHIFCLYLSVFMPFVWTALGRLISFANPQGYRTYKLHAVNMAAPDMTFKGHSRSFSYRYLTFIDSIRILLWCLIRKMQHCYYSVSYFI